MATKQIAWQTGSGNITLTYQGQGDGTISVQSDANNLGSARNQVITVETVGGAITRGFTISQAACPFPVGDIRNFSYTGNYQEVELPAGRYKLQCWGAQGGSNAAASSYNITAKAGGNGGYSEGIITLSTKTTVRVYVGGQGTSSAGGFNGGGSTTGSSTYNASDEQGVSSMGGGGGATDIRLSDGALLSRMIVAGGGAGGAMCYQKKTITVPKTVTFDSGSITPKKIEGSITPQSGPYTESGNTFYQGVVMNLPFSSGNSYSIQYSGDLYDIFFTKKNGTQNIGRWTGVITGNVSDLWLVVRSRTKSQINYSFIENTYGTHEMANGYYYSISAYQLRVKGFAFKAGHTYNLSVSGSGVNDYFISLNGNTNEGNSISLNSDNNNYWIIIRTTGTSDVSWTITDTYSETQTTETTDYQVGGVGGGTQGGAYSSTYAGKQNAAGSGGSFGQGAAQSATNYRYCSGAGGGGWYGGGGGQKSNSSMTYCKYSGGGSGFVNTAASSGNRPSGYTGPQLDSGNTVDGEQTFEAPAGGTETGHSGNGYARITRLN